MRSAATSVIAAAVIAVASIGCRRSLTGDDGGVGRLPAGAGGGAAATGDVGAGGAFLGVGGAAGSVGGGATGAGGGAGTGTVGPPGCGAAAGDAATGAIGEWAAWPMPNPVSTGLPHPQSYTVAGDVVIDDVTHLVWQRSPMDGVLSIAVASPYCDSLVYGGRDDWRLPRAIDLLSLIDYTRKRPALSPLAFDPALSHQYLSSTPAAPGSAARIMVDTVIGDTTETATDGEIICVAGGCPSPTASHYTVAGEVVRDMWTRLTWTQQPMPGTYTLDEATAACAGLTVDGGGWRIPSLNELETLIDRTQDAAPNINRQVFAETDTDMLLSIQYWTSSPIAGSDPPTQWIIGFYGGGNAFGDSPTVREQVRCVH